VIDEVTQNQKFWQACPCKSVSIRILVTRVLRYSIMLWAGRAWSAASLPLPVASADLDSDLRLRYGVGSYINQHHPSDCLIQNVETWHVPTYMS
jgi:hypothetical protein